VVFALLELRIAYVRNWGNASSPVTFAYGPQSIAVIARLDDAPLVLGDIPSPRDPIPRGRDDKHFVERGD